MAHYELEPTIQDILNYLLIAKDTEIDNYNRQAANMLFPLINTLECR